MGNPDQNLNKQTNTAQDTQVLALVQYKNGKGCRHELAQAALRAPLVLQMIKDLLSIVLLSYHRIDPLKRRVQGVCLFKFWSGFTTPHSRIAVSDGPLGLHFALIIRPIPSEWIILAQLLIVCHARATDYY